MEISFNYRKVSEEMPGQDEYENPGDCTDNVIKKEFLIIHRTNTCDEGSKCSEDWSKAGSNNGECAPSFKESLGIRQICFFKEAAILFKNFGTEVFSDVVITCIT